MRKKATTKRPYFTMESAMTATLRDASGRMHHGILFARRLRENISLPNSSCLISESFSSSNSLKIGSECESKIDLEIILITRFCKETRRLRLVLYVDPQTIIQ